MTKLTEIFQQLRSTGSSNEKQAILQKYKDLQELKMVFWMAEEPSINYFMKLNRHATRRVGDQELTLDILNDVKTKIIGRELTGNAAKQHVEEILASLKPEDAQILQGIINRDLECKVGRGIVTKIWPDLIQEMPCMLAGKMDAKTIAKITPKQDAYIVQKKCDGGRAMAIVDENGMVQFLSRNGKPLLTHGVFDSQLSKFPGYVFDGEMLVSSSMGVEDRATGNGFFNKAVRNTITPEEAIRFQYVVWDLIPKQDFFEGYCKTPYKDRLRMLVDASSKFVPNHIKVVESKVISSLEDCMKFYNEMINQGEEGAILKFADGPWESKRSSHMIKLKEELDIDAECIGWKPHSKKPGWIGSLIGCTRDKKVIFDVGSGLTDEDRQKDPSEFVGKIIQCKYNAVIGNKGSEEKSLFLPIFQCVRLDKTLANSLEELK